MTAAMQQRFKSLATDRSFWHNETTATHQDLAGLFIARAVERYLKTGGSFAFIVPNSVVDREYWAGFRRGQFDGAHVAFSPSWDLRRIRPHLFPRSSAVVFGTRTTAAKPMPTTALLWTGRAPHRHAHVETANQLRQHLGELSVGSEDDERSPYAVRFSNGANLYPRLLFRVEDAPTTGLGVPAGRVNVRSKRSATEKAPWKDVPELTGIVESEFVWPILLGEQIVPFRVLAAERFVLPLTSTGHLFDGEDPKIDAYPGLAAWTRAAEERWNAHRQTALTDEINRMKKLTQQLPISHIRVVYAKAGMHMAAAVVTDRRQLIENKLYWTAVTSEDEGHYLVGVLNAPCLTELVRPLMSYGKDERDIDKAVWKLPIPTYNASDPIQTEITELAKDLASEINGMAFRSDNFVTIRRDIRKHLISSPSGQRLDTLVGALLGVADGAAGPTVDLAPPTPTTTRLIRTTNTQPVVTTAGVEIDVDCEFDSDGKVYLWGALLSTPTTEPTYYAFSSPASDFDEYALATEFLAWIAEQLTTHDDTTAFWFHYGSTEIRQLQRILGPAANDVLAHGIDVLADTIRPNFYGPVGYSLKQLAPAAGAQWRTDGATGADTYAWIKAARAGDAAAWNMLTGYNEDDVRALRALRLALGQLDAPGSALELESPSQAQR